jgi:AraC-like DNA-binding protein
MANDATDPARTSLAGDEWMSFLRRSCANDLVGFDPTTFMGWFQRYEVYGLNALNAGSNIEKINRTPRHTRLDGIEDYSLIFQLTGRTAFDHNDRLLELDGGDVILVDPTRPMTVFNEPGLVRHLALHLPRQQLVSHLGFEPKGGLHRTGTAANRLLLQLMREALRDGADVNDLPESQMQLVVFDLLAALFAPERVEPTSHYSEKVFARICRLIEARFSDPDLTPPAVASEARISVRYLQKLFSARGTTCSRFIHALRLDRASYLLRRRALLKSGQPLGGIAFACGFLDYPHFSRKFRERFGHAPSAHVRDDGRNLTSYMALPG